MSLPDAEAVPEPEPATPLKNLTIPDRPHKDIAQATSSELSGGHTDVMPGAIDIPCYVSIMYLETDYGNMDILSWAPKNRCDGGQ